eukprot:3127842-Ditylum_brightwellii.AAC.1
MSELSPPMTFPLMEVLEYSAITSYTDEILMDTAKPLQDIDKYTQTYIDQLKYAEGVVLEEAKAALFQQYVQEVKTLWGRMPSVPLDISPAVVKTECEDPTIAEVNW